MVKNEQDIIEPMLRHNAALLDALIVLDNGSVDATRAIVVSVARELGNIIVTDSAKFGYTQGERMTLLLHAAQSSYFADFVLFLDADEFIGSANRTALHSELCQIPCGGCGAISWCNFVLTDDAVVDPPRGLTHRLSAESRSVSKVVLRLDGAFQPDLVVGRGSHVVIRSGQPLPAMVLPNLKLWHFPVRGRAQLSAKALVGWLACLAANPRAADLPQSYHWRSMYQRVVDGPGLDASDLRTLSLHYADPGYLLGQPPPPEPPTLHDPPPIDGVRRYSTGAFLDPLLLLARSWEQSLRGREPLFQPEEVGREQIGVEQIGREEVGREEAGREEVDIPPFRFLVEKHQPASVLDIGCGRGLGLELFGRLGVADLAGVGVLPRDSLMLRRGGYVSHDPTVGFTLGRRYALVLCLNLPSEQPAEQAIALIGNACRHAETMIAFSLNDPAERHLDRWLGGWQRLGWVPDLMETLALRCLSSTAALRRGLVILRPETTPGSATAAPCAAALRAASPGTAGPDVTRGLEATRELLAIARRPYRMPAPCGGVHEEALLDPAAASWLGYAA